LRFCGPKDSPETGKDGAAELLRADVCRDVAEPGFSGAEEVAGPISIGIWRAPADIAGAEFVAMAVWPSLPPTGFDVTAGPICFARLAENGGSRKRSRED
jgi:hypothetical protein